MSPSSKAIGYPPAVRRATLLTEFFFLCAADHARSRAGFQQFFSKQIRLNRRFVPYPVFSMCSSTLSEFLVESAQDGLIELNGGVKLTSAGRSRLDTLTPTANKILKKR